MQNLKIIKQIVVFGNAAKVVLNAFGNFLTFPITLVLCSHSNSLFIILVFQFIKNTTVFLRTHECILYIPVYLDFPE